MLAHVSFFFSVAFIKLRIECSNIDSNLKLTIAQMTSTKEMYLLLPFAGSNKEATLVSRITKANFRYAYVLCRQQQQKKICKNFF